MQLPKRPGLSAVIVTTGLTPAVRTVIVKPESPAVASVLAPTKEFVTVAYTVD
jgi:hypothetical protein